MKLTRLHMHFFLKNTKNVKNEDVMLATKFPSSGTYASKLLEISSHIFSIGFNNWMVILIMPHSSFFSLSVRTLRLKNINNYHKFTQLMLELTLEC